MATKPPINPSSRPPLNPTNRPPKIPTAKSPPKPPATATATAKPPTKPIKMPVIPKRPVIHAPLSPHTGPDPININTPDPFVGVPEVVTLNEQTFKRFIRSKDATMVLFYDETDERAQKAKESLIQAVGSTVRDNHAFGAVNCVENQTLCRRQWTYKVSLPVFKLFAGGHVVNTFDYTTSAEDITKFVDRSPAPVPHRFFKSMCSCVDGCEEDD